METLKSSRPVVAVIYAHSHVDHFGGVRGVVDEADVRSGKVKVIAPEGFMDNAIAENVLAGNAMSRRANYMYGISLPANDKGSVGTGLGMTLSNGAPGLIPPTVIVTKTGEEMTIDGVRIQFQMAQDSRGAVGDDDVSPREEGAVPVGGGGQADAQRLYHPRRQGARRAGVEQVHQRDTGLVP